MLYMLCMLLSLERRSCHDGLFEQPRGCSYLAQCPTPPMSGHPTTSNLSRHTTSRWSLPSRRGSVVTFRQPSLQAIQQEIQPELETLVLIAPRDVVGKGHEVGEPFDWQ
jgi:hypothetical protein